MLSAGSFGGFACPGQGSDSERREPDLSGVKGRVSGCLQGAGQTPSHVWSKALVPPQLLSSCSEPAGPPCAPAPAPNPPVQGQESSQHQLGQPGQLPVLPALPTCW